MLEPGTGDYKGFPKESFIMDCFNPCVYYSVRLSCPYPPLEHVYFISSIFSFYYGDDGIFWRDIITGGVILMELILHTIP